MKFILNENAKFVLEERFSLTEAPLFEKTLPSFKKLNDTIRNIQAKLSDLLKTLESGAKLTAIDGDNTATITTITTTCTKVKDLITKQKFEELLSKLQTKLTELGSKSIKDPAENTKLEKLQAASGELYSAIQIVIDNVTSLAKADTTKRSRHLQRLSEALPKIKTNIDLFYDLLKKSEPDATPKEKQIDWAALYKACEECTNVTDANKAFWEGGLPKTGEENPNKLPTVNTDAEAAGYYKGEWGDRADTIKSFGIAFIKCLKKEGWSAILNPIVAFLKTLFKISLLAIFISVAGGAGVRGIFKLSISPRIFIVPLI